MSESARTCFSGLSLWAEVPILQPIINEIASTYHLFPHPSHMTLVYGLPSNVPLSVVSLFDRLLETLPRCGVEIKPTHLEAGISKLFGHGYCDLFFERNALLDSLFHVSMEELDWNYKRDSFAGAPHLCLGYSNEVEIFSSGGIKDVLMNCYPALLTTSYKIEKVSLWRTEGTLQEWQQLKSIRIC